MKPIKFRAWDIKNKKWIKTYYGHVKYIPITNDNTGLIEVSYSSELADACVNEKWEKEEIILVQFTGLLDKNEKEIFYGDILECGNEKDFNWYVSDKFYYPTLCECKGDLCRSDLMKDNPMHYEIIGNIYENPELIK